MSEASTADLARSCDELRTRSLLPARRRLTITADGIGARDGVRVVVLHDDVEVGIEVLLGPPDSEPCAGRLGTDHLSQEGNVAAALHERARLVVAIAGPGARLARRNRP